MVNDNVAQLLFDEYIEDVHRYCVGSSFNPMFMREIESQILLPVDSTDPFRKEIARFIQGEIHQHFQKWKGISSLAPEIKWTCHPQIKLAIIGYMAKYHPDELEKPGWISKYRSITDPWEPAW